MRNRQFRSEFPNVPRTVLGGAAIFSWAVQENRFCGDETFAAIFGMDKVEVAAGLPIEQYLHYVNPDERARVSRFDRWSPRRRQAQCRGARLHRKKSPARSANQGAGVDPLAGRGRGQPRHPVATFDRHIRPPSFDRRRADDGP